MSLILNLKKFYFDSVKVPKDFFKNNEKINYADIGASNIKNLIFYSKFKFLNIFLFEPDQRVIKNYNVMGLAKASLEANVRYMSHSLGHKNIRVNGISAGPIKTLAASGISGFNEILKHVEDKSALKRNITTVEVANTALFLASQSSSAITGQIIYVDCGFNISGV